MYVQLICASEFPREQVWCGKMIVFIIVFNYNMDFLKHPQSDGLECVCEFTLWFGVLELLLSQAVK